MGVLPQNALVAGIDFPPTRRALPRNCAAERVDLPRKREMCNDLVATAAIKSLML